MMEDLLLQDVVLVVLVEVVVKTQMVNQEIHLLLVHLKEAMVEAHQVIQVVDLVEVV